MNLLVDIGNTRIKWASQLDQCLVSTDAIVHRDQEDLSALISRCWQNLEPPARIIVSNVAGQRIEQVLIDWIRDGGESFLSLLGISL